MKEDQSNGTINTLRRGEESRRGRNCVVVDRKIPTSDDNRRTNVTPEVKRRLSQNSDTNYISSLLKENPVLDASLRKNSDKWNKLSPKGSDKSPDLFRRNSKTTEEMKMETFEALQHHLNLIPPPLPYKTNNEAIDKLMDIHNANMAWNSRDQLYGKASPAASEGGSVNIRSRNGDKLEFESQDPHSFRFKAASKLGATSKFSSKISSMHLIRSTSEQISAPNNGSNDLSPHYIRKMSSKDSLSCKNINHLGRNRKKSLELITENKELEGQKKKVFETAVFSKSNGSDRNINLGVTRPPQEDAIMPEDVLSSEMELTDNKEQEVKQFFENSDFEIKPKTNHESLDEQQGSEPEADSPPKVPALKAFMSEKVEENDDKDTERRRLSLVLEDEKGPGQEDNPILVSFG